MLGIIGIIASIILLVLLAMKQVSALWGTLICSAVVILTNGMSFTDAITKLYMPGAGSAVSLVLPILICGAILAKLYTESGAAVSISKTIFKALVKPEAPPRTRRRLAIIIVLLSGGLLSWGGIHVIALMFTIYPLVLDICKQADLPKKHIVGLLMGATCSFAMTAPGSPQMVNIFSSTYLGTTATVGLIPGLIGVAAEFIFIFFALDFWFERDRKRTGEGFVPGPKDKALDESKPLPPFMTALLPIVVLFVLFNFFKLDLAVVLIIVVPIAIILFWKYIPHGSGLVGLINQGASSSLGGLILLAAMSGFGSVVKATDGYSYFMNAFLNLDMHPYLKIILCISVMACVVGASATGIMLVLPEIAPALLAQGVSASALHRIACFSASTLDSLPNCGAFLAVCEFADVKVKDSYPGVFFTTVLATMFGTAVVTLLFLIYPGWA